MIGNWTDRSFKFLNAFRLHCNARDLHIVQPVLFAGLPDSFGLWAVASRLEMTICTCIYYRYVVFARIIAVFTATTKVDVGSDNWPVASKLIKWSCGSVVTPNCKPSWTGFRTYCRWHLQGLQNVFVLLSATTIYTWPQTSENQWKLGLQSRKAIIASHVCIS